MGNVFEAIKSFILSIPLKIIALIIGVFLVCHIYMSRGYVDAFVFAFLPIAFILACRFVGHPQKLFFIFLVLDYFIMGINRYYPIKSGLVMSIISVVMLLLVVLKYSWMNKDIHVECCFRNPMFVIWLIWFAYCVAQLFRPDIYSYPWFVGIGSYAFYALLSIFFISVFFKNYKSVKFFLALWSVCTLICVFKGLWQKFVGFDNAEKLWLYQGGGRTTHILYSGIRYFSFFSDAANFGIGMGMSLMVFGIAAFYQKKVWMKFYFGAVALLAGYGMMISGTRSAMMVPFAALATFIVCSGKVRSTVYGILILAGLYFFFNFTTIGNSVQYVRRMRSAFDTSDASLNVRLDNQAKLKPYMASRPFGVGIQMSKDPKWQHYTKVPEIATDSWFVKIWVETGIVGLALHLTLMAILFAWGGYIILFKIHNRELRGVMTAMFAGAIGVFAASYGNEVMGYPNGLVVWICEAFVFVSPYIEEHFEEEKDKELKTI